MEVESKSPNTNLLGDFSGHFRCCIKDFFCVKPQNRKQKYFSLTFVGGCYLKMHLHVAVSPLNVGLAYVGVKHDGGEGVL